MPFFFAGYEIDFERIKGRPMELGVAFCARELPLVLAITTIAIEDGHMPPSTAAGLVGAAMLSTLIYPFVGMALRKGAAAGEAEGEPPAPSGEIAPATV